MKSLMSKVMILVAISGVTASTVFAEGNVPQPQTNQKVMKVKKRSSSKKSGVKSSATTNAQPSQSAK
jgi:hypothetical protein